MKALMASITSWWITISKREQRLLLGGAFLFFVAAIYWGLIQPLSDRADKAQLKIVSEKQLLNWVTDKADQIVELRGSAGTPTSSKPMNQIISESVRRYNIELIRMQPRDNMLQVWVKPVEFNQFVSWLDFLKMKQGISVEFMDISAADSKGIIDVKRLQLKRGG